ncbi:MAG: response regulator [Pseudobacteriovorax sp.]|nr:response regulator [Pseudobacteriovorax sp.]
MKKIALLIDDEPDLLDMLKTEIEDCGIATLTAGNSETAQNLLEKHTDSISVVLSDVYMGGGSGLDILNHMQNHDSLKRIPFFIMSAGPASQFESAQLSQLEGYIEKPFDVEAVVNIVKKFC